MAKSAKAKQQPHAQKMDTYLDEIHHAIREFKDEIMCIDNHICSKVYEHFVTSVQAAYGQLYTPVGTASVQMVLETIADKDGKSF